MQENKYPKQVILEITSHCNLQCKGCAFHGPDAFTRRPKGFMAKRTWKMIIDEIASWPVEVNLTTHGGGEPILHPDLLGILEYAKKHQNIKVGFLTNATLLTEELAGELVALKIDWIAFSVDGVDAATHALVRPGGKLEIIENNITRFLNIVEKQGHTMETLINMVQYPEVKGQSEAFLEKWLGRVDVVRLSPYREPPSSRRWPGVTRPRRACELLWSQAVVAWDGRVGLCCEDMDIDVELGNAGDVPLLSIWNGQDITHIRDLHENGLWNDVPLCATCDTWADGDADILEDSKKGIKVVRKVSGTEYAKLTPAD